MKKEKKENFQNLFVKKVVSSLSKSSLVFVANDFENDPAGAAEEEEDDEDEDENERVATALFLSLSLFLVFKKRERKRKEGRCRRRGTTGKCACGASEGRRRCKTRPCS